VGALELLHLLTSRPDSVFSTTVIAEIVAMVTDVMNCGGRRKERAESGRTGELYGMRRAVLTLAIPSRFHWHHQGSLAFFRGRAPLDRRLPAARMASQARLRWAVDICKWNPGPAEFEYLLGLLPPEEREQCRKYKFPDDRKRALVSRLLQRGCAATALGLPFREAVIRRTRGGKPYIASACDRSAAPNFNYSVSH
jgi:hypothetical protein